MLVDDVTRRFRHADKVGFRCIRLRQGREDDCWDEARLLDAYTQEPVSHISGNQGFDEKHEEVM